MFDRFNTMPRRELTVDWGQDKGEINVRSHALGVGGIHSMPAPAPIVEATAALKPRMVRIFLQEFFFIYPDHDVFDWSKLDAYMDAIHAMGGDIMASICIKPKALYPVIDQSVWMPTDVAEWQRVIRALVLRYSKEKKYVTHWAIANEMNIGELGGCPYLIKNPDDFFEYYKITAEPIREALPDVKVGGPSFAGNGEGAANYLGRFAELCKANNVAVDFTCYNSYGSDPEVHVSGCRCIREALDRHDPGIKLYMTEFNNSIQDSIQDGPAVEEKAYEPRCAAALGASILALCDAACLDGSFQYHIYDQWSDPGEFTPWYASTEFFKFWNETVYRIGLLDLDGKPRPQYFLYQLLYTLAGRRAALSGTDTVLRGIASRDDGGLFIFLTNYDTETTPEGVTRITFANAPEGLYRLEVRRIDATTAAQMKAAPMSCLPPCESRLAYMRPEFQFDVFTPADSVTLVRFIRQPSPPAT